MNIETEGAGPQGVLPEQPQRLGGSEYRFYPITSHQSQEVQGLGQLVSNVAQGHMPATQYIFIPSLQSTSAQSTIQLQTQPTLPPSNIFISSQTQQTPSPQPTVQVLNIQPQAPQTSVFIPSQEQQTPSPQPMGQSLNIQPEVQQEVASQPRVAWRPSEHVAQPEQPSSQMITTLVSRYERPGRSWTLRGGKSRCDAWRARASANSPNSDLRRLNLISAVANDLELLDRMNPQSRTDVLQALRYLTPDEIGRLQEELRQRGGRIRLTEQNVSDAVFYAWNSNTKVALYQLLPLTVSSSTPVTQNALSTQARSLLPPTIHVDEINQSMTHSDPGVRNTIRNIVGTLGEYPHWQQQQFLARLPFMTLVHLLAEANVAVPSASYEPEVTEYDDVNLLDFMEPIWTRYRYANEESRQDFIEFLNRLITDFSTRSTPPVRYDENGQQIPPTDDAIKKVSRVVVSRQRLVALRNALESS